MLAFLNTIGSSHNRSAYSLFKFMQHGSQRWLSAVFTLNSENMKMTFLKNLWMNSNQYCVRTILAWSYNSFSQIGYLKWLPSAVTRTSETVKQTISHELPSEFWPKLSQTDAFAFIEFLKWSPERRCDRAFSRILVFILISLKTTSQPVKIIEWSFSLTLLHSEMPKFYAILAFLGAVGLIILELSYSSFLSRLPIVHKH